MAHFYDLIGRLIVKVIMMKKTIQMIVLALLSSVLAACASPGNAPGQSSVIIDTKGVDMQAYERDLSECEAYAAEVEVAEKAVVGGTVGGVIGGAIGAIFNGSRGAERSGGAGAVLGTARGASEGLEEQSQVIRRCLRGRGYRVLN